MNKSEITKIDFAADTITAKEIAKIQETPPKRMPRTYFSWMYILRVIGNVNKNEFPLSKSS